MAECKAEAKIVATHRLRKENRWEAATLFRDEQRERLRADGMKRREAREESWRLMLEKFSALRPIQLRPIIRDSV